MTYSLTLRFPTSTITFESDNIDKIESLSKFCKEDLRKLRFFFNSIASNIAIIESEGYERKNKDKRKG